MVFRGWLIRFAWASDRRRASSPIVVKNPHERNADSTVLSCSSLISKIVALTRMSVNFRGKGTGCREAKSIERLECLSFGNSDPQY